MDRDRQLIDANRLGGATGKDGDVRRQDQLPRDHALRIVVALDDEDTNTRAIQPHHLLAEKQARVEILPVAVVEVTGEEHEIDACAQGLVDESFEGASRRGAQTLNRRAVVTVQSAQRAVEVQIGGVEEAHQAINSDRSRR